MLSRDEYMETFSMEVWRRVNELNRDKHTLFDCRECASSLHLSDELCLKKINRSFVEEVRKSMPATPRVLQPIVIQNNNERTPRPRRQLLTTNDVPDYLYKAIVRESRKDQELVLKDSAKLGLYSSDISMRQYDHLRMTTHGEMKENPPKNHTGPVDSYEFDREMVSNHLQQVADENNDLGKNMDGKWTELARKATMRKIGGTELPGNAGQVSPILILLRKYYDPAIRLFCSVLNKTYIEGCILSKK